jgi:effector-binding domain-containing protein
MIEQFEITEKKEQPVLLIRVTTAVGNLPQEIGKAYGAIAQYMAEIGQPAQEAPYTAYFNMDMEHLDVEMGFPVAQPLPGKGEIKAGSIPAGKQASCVYHGPYSGMGPAYEALTAKVNESGYTPTGVYYEFYYNAPGEVPDSELLTKIMFPLK